MHSFRLWRVPGLQQNPDHHGFGQGAVLHPSVRHSSVLLHVGRHAGTPIAADMRSSSAGTGRVSVLRVRRHFNENQQDFQVICLCLIFPFVPLIVL